MVFRLSRAASLAFLIAAPSAHASTLPSCAPPVEVSDVSVARVEPNGALVLQDGRAAHVEGLVLPAGAKDHAPSFLAAQALSQLSDLTLGRRVILAAQAPKQDRYDRVRAQVFFSTDDAEPWLQIAMLRRGLARVSIAPDRVECVAELYAAEAQARDKHMGIWATSAYAIRTSNIAAADFGTFQIVEGKVLNASISGGRAYLNFGTDRRTDFTVTISPDDMKAFRAANSDPTAYEGQTIRVRGIVEQMNGPEIEVAGPQAIEVVSTPPLRPGQAQ